MSRNAEPESTSFVRDLLGYILVLLMWALTLILVLFAIALIPSFASIGFLAAALLVCPSKRLREFSPMARLRELVPRKVLTGITVLLVFVSLVIAPASDDASSSTGTTRSATSGDVIVSGPIEYTTEAIDAYDYLSCKDDGATLSLKNDIVASKVGDQDITVEIRKGLFGNKTEVVTVTVEDTTPPTIELDAAKVSIELDDEIDPSDNVVRVSDPVDGEFDEITEEPQALGSNVGLERIYDAGWYLVEGDCDTSKAGNYEFTVTASDKHGNNVEKDFTIEVIDPLADVSLNQTTEVLEYSDGEVDAVKLVECSDSDVTVTAEKIDLRSTGEKKVEYTLTKGAHTKVITHTFKVRDTKKPKISLSSDSVAIDYGASFDPYSNVASAEDPVDGQLTRCNTEPSENGDGWYTVNGSYDANKAGKYYFTVEACDRNGNKVQKEFSLKVSDPPEVVDDAHDYIININTGKFHYPTCRDVKQMNESNKNPVHENRDNLVAMGYSPCGHCNP